MFKLARWKLTGWYLLIICLISLTFSTIIYKMVGMEIDRLSSLQRIRWERRLELRGLRPTDLLPQPPPLPFDDPDLAQDAKQRLVTILGFVNGGILIISAGLGYFLSGLTLRPIKKMVDEQNRFVADASHELKTPLTSLKSSFEVFLRERKPSTSETKTLIVESVEEVNHLQKLSEGLLALANNKTSTTKNSQTIKLKNLVSRVVKKYSKAAKVKKVVLLNQVGDEHIVANELEVEILIGNLVDNALKYSHNGGRVEVRSRQEKQGVSLIVEDNGIGIETKDIAHIFERFYRADSARSRSGGGGYGLGLAIAQKIAQDNGAKIKVISQAGVGSKFSVIFQ